MKIRQGFVSNSSSSSFVVYIPENFQLSENDYRFIFDHTEMDSARDVIEKFKALKKEYPYLAKEFDEEIERMSLTLMEDDEETEFQNYKPEIDKYINVLKSGQEIDEYENSEAFNAFTEFFQNKNLVITGIDVSSDASSIVPVTEKQLNKIKNNYNA